MRWNMEKDTQLNTNTLTKKKQDEKQALLDAATVIDIRMRLTEGGPKLILNNAMAHVLARYYENGYTVTYEKHRS